VRLQLLAHHGWMRGLRTGASENKWLPPVEDLPPAREIMTADERLKLKKELTAARNR